MPGAPRTDPGVRFSRTGLLALNVRYFRTRQVPHGAAIAALQRPFLCSLCWSNKRRINTAYPIRLRPDCQRVHCADPFAVPAGYGAHVHGSPVLGLLRIGLTPLPRLLRSDSSLRIPRPRPGRCKGLPRCCTYLLPHATLLDSDGCPALLLRRSFNPSGCPRQRGRLLSVWTLWVSGTFTPSPTASNLVTELNRFRGLRFPLRPTAFSVYA